MTGGSRSPAARDGPRPQRPTDPDRRRRANPDPILSAKLAVPPPPPFYLPRPRLADILTEGSRGGVTAVTGAAGSGKTVLVSSWVQAGLAPGPVAWLTLDAADNVPGAFWSYVLEALQLRTPGVDDLIGTSPQASTFSRAFLGRIAMSLAETPQPAVLVLDRCEHITNRAIAADLDLLLRYSTPGLRLVVVGRSARLLPLHRYQLAGELTEIDNESLTLRPDEATALLQSHGLQLTEDEGDALLASTQGWMTGICLHALTPRPGRGDTAGVPDPTDHHAVGNYLRTEVLYGQAPRTRDLLLRTSILDEIHPSLADRMTGRYDAHGIFEELVRANAFVQPLGESWYRVHPLFRELLHDELTARHPDLVRRLHGLAAHWYADRGRVTDALRHAARVDEWDYAATLAVDRLGVSRLLTGSDAEELRAVFARLPGDQPSGAAALVRAALALARFDITAARTELDLAQSPAPGEPDDRQVHFRLAITVLEMVLARLSGDTAAAERAADDAKEHWNRISPADLPDGPRIRAMLLSNLGVAQLWAGDHAAARGSLGRVAAAVEPATEYSVHDALGHLALAELVEGKLHRADKYAREALAVAEAAGLRPAAQVGAANVAMAAVALEWNDLPAVRERLSRAIAAPGSRHDPATATIIALLRAYAAISRRDGRRALAAVQGARAKLENWHVPAAVWEQLDLATAQAYLASGDLVAARETLGSVPDSPQRTLLLAQAHLLADEPAEAGRQLEALPTHPTRPAILQDAALLRAQLAAGAGDATAAEQELRKALELARPEQRRRPFAEAGDLVQRLLRQHPDIVAEHTWLSPQLGPPGRRPATEPSVVVEQLTAREIEVLRRLARALSTDDIARELYLSVNTVKTHLKSIYRKLGTSGRSATARRARELRLIDDRDPDPPPSPDAG